jgi:uroporphyrinogen-III synthase
LSERALVVFVSPNAVEEFFAVRPLASTWPESTVAASVGPGTTHALARHGVPEKCIAEPAADSIQFDSESLWRSLSHDDWDGKSVLIVRGDGGRDWLADTLRSNGAVVSFVAAYRRMTPEFDGVERDLLTHALADPARHLWFFSSSEAISNLVAAVPQAQWSSARAIATHPRIAQRARDCGFGVVGESPPTLEGAMACIQSIAS